MTTRKNLPGFGAAYGAPGAALVALLLAGCGPDNDPVDVEPMELTDREVPALDGTRAEDTALDNEIDPMLDDDVDVPERYLLAEAEIRPVGAHFSPAGDPHGSPQEPDARHHAGDLGNITADEDGNSDFKIIDTDLQLGSDSHSIIGRAIIVHADADNLATQPAGNAGARVGCAVIKPELQPAYVLE